MSTDKKPAAVKLLLSDARGIYIPRDFVTNFDVTKWGLEADDEDVLTCQDPDNEWYWDAWDSILNKAKHVKHGHVLYQDGDLFALNYDEMTCEEKRNFGDDDHRECTEETCEAR